MEVNAANEGCYLDFKVPSCSKFVLSYRYMVETAVSGEGSVACYALYPNEFVRIITNANTGSTFKYCDGSENAIVETELETKMGVWYTLYTAVDLDEGIYSILRKADGDSEYTVVVEDIQLQDVPRTPLLRLMTERNSEAIAYYDDLVIRTYDSTAEPTANAADAYTQGEVLFSEDFETTIDELTAREDVTLQYGDSCLVEIVDGKLKMEVNAANEGCYLDFKVPSRSQFVFSYRYMVETAVPDTGSVACYVLYPNEFVRIITNANTGSTFKYCDGSENAIVETELETKMGVWYTLYTAVDLDEGIYSILRKADGDSVYTVVVKDIQLQDVPRTPLLRLMTEWNSEAVAYYDDLVIRTYDPTAESTVVPTATPKPTATPEPTATPTSEPTAEPTATPTDAPTDAPTEKPEERKGCKSVVLSSAMVAAAVLLGTAVIVKKKDNE